MNNPNQIVLTTYFTEKNDPQRDKKQKTDNFSLMQVWYESIHRVEVPGLIFHDRLSEEFTTKWTTDLVKFQKYKLKTTRSVNDERYYCYLEWLESRPEIERLFMLDLFDVEFFRDPFTVMDDEKYDIYCGGDPGEYNNQLNKEKMIKAYGKPLYETQIKLHAGTCGGKREPIIKLLKAMCSSFDGLTRKKKLENLNMAVYNKCVYDLFPVSRIKYGYPLNSRFKKFEKHGNFAIRHK